MKIKGVFHRQLAGMGFPVAPLVLRPFFSESLPFLLLLYHKKTLSRNKVLVLKFLFLDESSGDFLRTYHSICKRKGSFPHTN